MKSIIFSLCFLLSYSLFSQKWASTSPENKKVILEEFSGVRCGSCPQAHQIVNSLTQAHPEDVLVVVLHPVGDWHTEPLNPGDLDLRHSYANAFFNSAFFGGTIYMPAGLVNRREWQPGIRATGRENWSRFADTIMAEASPLNVGMRARYNPVSKELEVEGEIYYSDDLSEAHNVYVLLVEDSLVAPQTGQGNNYVHKHIFREKLNQSVWGDKVADSARAGNLHSFSYQWTNADEHVNMEHAQVIAFVRNKGNGEIISGAGEKVVLDATTNIPDPEEWSFSLYPNPAREKMTIRFSLLSSSQLTFRLLSLAGKQLQSWPHMHFGAGEQSLEIKLEDYPAGIYLLEISDGRQLKREKVLISK